MKVIFTLAYPFIFVFVLVFLFLLRWSPFGGSRWEKCPRWIWWSQRCRL